MCAWPTAARLDARAPTAPTAAVRATGPRRWRPRVRPPLRRRSASSSSAAASRRQGASPASAWVLGGAARCWGGWREQRVRPGSCERSGQVANSASSEDGIPLALSFEAVFTAVVPPHPPTHGHDRDVHRGVRNIGHRFGQCPDRTARSSSSTSHYCLRYWSESRVGPRSE